VADDSKVKAISAQQRRGVPKAEANLNGLRIRRILRPIGKKTDGSLG
jgi:hypothetical protein